ncbi:mitochondrial 37S ribosomal protein mS41 [Aspergillus candidus]|uniref:Small ribosomal subunit protein mS41 n=1 Tax=Aspergillus candidus TaxID=41067 RepID=A0A2I2F7V0_ASPCN|nr:IGR protein motif-domain-containing protein [Aspergillus candidus]PLB36706.1 IGR protein motif-domain-containing protein [Aspergillus candidus]
MALRNPQLLAFRPIRPSIIANQCIRHFHGQTSKPSTVPPPTPFVPNVETFLSLIGRGMSKHASKLPSWDKLFTLSSAELRDLGIEPARQRRYLLRKREKFRQGIYGPGGDLQHVADSAAQLRVVEVPVDPKAPSQAINSSNPTNASATLTPGMRKVIVNLPPDATKYTPDLSTPLQKFAHMKIHRGSMLKGPFLQPIKGTNGTAALIKAQEGMWEDKLGHKVDGGERRRAEVRANRRIEERRKGTA